MADYFAPAALLPNGWATGVRFSVSPTGSFAGVASDSRAVNASVLRGVMVPGVPNVHSHAFQRALVGLAEGGRIGGGGSGGGGNGGGGTGGGGRVSAGRRSPGEPSSAPPAGAPDTFWSWRERMYALLAILTPEDVQAIAAQVYVEMLEAGYTAVAEFHYLHNDAWGARYDTPGELSHRVLAAARDAGIGMTLLPTLYRTSGFGDAPLSPHQRRFVLETDELLELREGLVRGWEGPAVRVGLALHSLRAVPPAALEEAWGGIGDADGLPPVHIHVAEQRREVEECVAFTGARPVAWLLDHLPVDSRWTLIHATHADPRELAAVAASGATVGLCPTTEANLGDGIFDLPALLSRGGHLAIGSDSQVSVDPREELRLLEYGQRLRDERRSVAAAPDAPSASVGRTLLDAAWRGGAEASGRPLGRIAEGHRADWIVLDPDHPTLAGRTEDALLDSWVFAGSRSRSPILEVWVGGKQVVGADGHRERQRVGQRYGEVARRLVALL